MQSTQDKEFHSKLKKNFSVLQNALSRAQVEEGLIGDNTAVFTPSEGSDRHYESAKRLAKYLNTIKVCKNRYDTDCDGLYYPIEYATKKGYTQTTGYSALALADGSIYIINQYENCSEVMNDCVRDEDGVCTEDDNGNTTQREWNRSFCATVHVDVNGAKKPNRYGKDIFEFNIRQDYISINAWSAAAPQKVKDILTNKI